MFVESSSLDDASVMPLTPAFVVTCHEPRARRDYQHFLRMTLKGR